ncbi:MAG: hypothetical protein V1913_09915 [Fibrobacterota bacterium]
MKKTITILATLALAAFAVAATGPGTESGTGETIQVWEQNQTSLKTCAEQQIQLQDQIKTLEQAKLQASTDVEKTQIQGQIEAKTQELTQAQTRYTNMLANHRAYKYEWVDANGDGKNDNVSGSVEGDAKSYMYKNGNGYGYGFVDGNSDGINDNFIDADNDGKCDTDAAMLKTRTQSRDKVKGKSQHGDHNKVQDRDQLRGDR